MDSAEAGWGSGEGLAQTRCHIEYYPHEYPPPLSVKGAQEEIWGFSALLGLYFGAVARRTRG